MSTGSRDCGDIRVAYDFITQVSRVQKVEYHKLASHHVSVVDGLAYIVTYCIRGTSRGGGRCAPPLDARLRGRRRNGRIDAGLRWGGPKGGRTHRTPQVLHGLEQRSARLTEDGLRSVRGGRGMLRGGFAQEAVDDVPEGGEARVDESEGLVVRGGDACVDVGLVLDEVWFEVGFVDVRRALRSAVSAWPSFRNIFNFWARASNCGRER
jgi:hypothetical protein